MALKDIDQLKAEIDAAVHTNGALGKTTAPGLNALLKSLAVELTARPEAGALDVAAALAGAAPGAVPSVAATVAGLQDAQYQQPFVFAVSAGGSPLAVATLPLAQARRLVLGAVASVALLALDATTGDEYTLTATYDAAAAAFALSGTTPDGTALTARQVGGGAAPVTFATLAGQPADNAALAAALADGQNQQPFLFALEDPATGNRSSLSLSLAQARALVTGTVPSVVLTSPDPSTGDLLTFTATYDAASAALRLSGINSQTGTALTARQVGGGAAAPATPATFATLAGQPADNAALAAALAAKATAQPAPALEFVFEAGFADAIGRTLGPRQAGTYASEQRQNVSAVAYQVNGVGVAAPTYQPLTLASGDVLQVAITRLNTAQPAVLTLLS